jgi:hypothetical protein
MKLLTFFTIVHQLYLSFYFTALIAASKYLFTPLYFSAYTAAALVHVISAAVSALCERSCSRQCR